MSFKSHVGMLTVACLGLMASAPVAHAAENAEAVDVLSLAELKPADWLKLRTVLKTTDEEWGVILPQLWRIHALREDLEGTAETAQPGGERPGMFNGALGGPMGGTSLSAPVMPGRGGRGGGAGGGANGAGPFDPKKAPGADEAGSLGGAFRGLLVRGMIAMMMPSQDHPVQAMLGELQTLAGSPDATDEQIREKLAMVRAVRKKAARDLSVAQAELLPYLTLDQTAVLVVVGLLD